MKPEPIAIGKVVSLAINGIPTEDIAFGLDGPGGDEHIGFARGLSGHDGAYIKSSDLKRGHRVANWRTWTGLSAEEIGSVSKAIGYDISTGLLLENITVEGIPNFSKLDPTSRLVFPSHELDGVLTQAVLAVWEENGPCATVGKRLEEHHGIVGLKTDFIREAQGKRGVMGLVLSAGTVSVGDEVRVYPPVR